MGDQNIAMNTPLWLDSGPGSGVYSLRTFLAAVEMAYATPTLGP
jgi:hypothetical protein